MTFNKYLDNLELIEGEEVLYNTNAKMKNYGKTAFFMTLALGLIFGFMFAGLSGVDLFTSIYIIFLCIIFWGAFGILIWDMLKKEEQSCYYITRKRLIKICGHGFLPYKFKHKITYLNDIAYFHDTGDGIDIITKGPEGELHYNGKEKKYLDQTPKIAKKIQLFFESKNKKNKTEMIKVLMNQIPAEKHPNLKKAYLNSKKYYELK